MLALFSKSDRDAIAAAVKAAESKTSGEIVAAVVSRSSTYDWIGYRAALIGWAAASMLALWMHFYRPFMLEFWETQAVQVGGLAFGWLLSRFHFGARFLVSADTLAEEVRQAAHVSFIKHGLVNTRDRTGVLVFVSLRERRVQILADQGINAKVADGFWKAETMKVVEGIRSGKAAEGLISAIQSIGEKLEKNFPRKDDDTNELPDDLRTE